MSMTRPITRPVITAVAGGPALRRQTNIVRAIFRDGSPGLSGILEEAIKANEAALGPELMVNGTFDADLSGWGGNLAAWTWDAGKAKLTGNGTAQIFVSPQVLEIGKTYVVSVDVNMVGGAVGFQVAGGSGLVAYATVGRICVPWKADAAGLTFKRESGTITGTLDNVSVREIDLSKVRAWQDAAGTLPYTDVTQPLGLLLDDSKGLVRGVELVLNGSNLVDTSNWAPQGGAVLDVSGGGLTVTGAAGARAEQGGRPSGINKWFEVTGYALLGAGVTSAQINYAKTSDGSSIASASTSVSGPLRLVVLGVESTAMFKCRVASGTGTATFTNISVRELPGNHIVQPSNTAARPIVGADANGVRYSAIDGVDDWMETGVIDPAGATEVHLVMGIKQLKDLGATGVLFEFGPDALTNAGTLGLFGPGSSGALRLSLISRGTPGIYKNLATDLGGVTLGAKAVISASVNLTTGYMRIRVNGATVAEQTVALGGSFSAQKAYIGKRANNTLYGKFDHYASVLHFGPLTDSQLRALERGVNKPTKAY